MRLKLSEENKFCCFRKLLLEESEEIDHSTSIIIQDKNNKCHRNNQEQQQCNILLNKYYNFINTATKKLRYNRSIMAVNPNIITFTLTSLLLIMTLISTTTITPIKCLSTSPRESSLDYQSSSSSHQQIQQNQASGSHHLFAQARVGGLDPNDYIDEASEIEVLANQQQIPTAQLMAAAGHIVPDNFFLPGGSIPALYARFQQQQQQQQQEQQQQQQQQQKNSQQQQDQMQQVASHIQARHVPPPTSAKYQQAMRQSDLLAAAAAAAEQQHTDNSALIDYNTYNLVQQDSPGAQATGSGQDVVDYLSSAGQQALYEQQQHQHFAEQQIAAELAALTANNNNNNNNHHHFQQQQQQHQANFIDNSAQSSSNENSVIDPDQYLAASLGPAYQISPHNGGQESVAGAFYSGNEQQPPQQLQQQQSQSHQGSQKPFGLPTKSSSKEPSGMLKPLGNPKTVSSPAIDFVANQLPKTSTFDKIADKLPPSQTPTIFSFSSSKDPNEKVKAVNQKKRNVMRQAEQLARATIKMVNDKFGTTIGDQTDIPFLLSSFGPLGMAQNLLFDPTLLVTLLNSAEKTYFSDVLPGPAKTAIRPVLNLFRVPNKKRDKANLLNMISFLASGGQVPSSTQAKHRQGTGIEKASKGKNKE